MTEKEVYKKLDEAGIDYEFITDHGDGMHIIIKYEKEEIESDLVVYDDDVALGYSIVKSNREVSGVFMVDGEIKDVDYFKKGEELDG